MYAFGKMMRKLIAEHGTTQAAICRATGIKKQNFCVFWLTAQATLHRIYLHKYRRNRTEPQRIARIWDALGTRM